MVSFASFGKHHRLLCLVVEENQFLLENESHYNYVFCISRHIIDPWTTILLLCVRNIVAIKHYCGDHFWDVSIGWTQIALEDECTEEKYTLQTTLWMCRM